jgi:hypothetical protein
MKLSVYGIGGVAGEGHSYLKSPMWWTGMILSKFLTAVVLAVVETERSKVYMSICSDYWRAVQFCCLRFHDRYFSDSSWRAECCH